MLKLNRQGSEDDSIGYNLAGALAVTLVSFLPSKLRPQISSLDSARM